jgi:hypothetical protein
VQEIPTEPYAETTTSRGLNIRLSEFEMDWHARPPVPAWLFAKRGEMPAAYKRLTGTNMVRSSPFGQDWSGLAAEYPEDRRPTLTGSMNDRQRLEVITPDLAGATGDQARLVLWWAVLYALSMRARYEPQWWTNDLDPDRCIYAVTVESILERALLDCPETIEDAIRAVNIDDRDDLP